MKALATGDTVVVCKLDRIARSSKDLHNILGELKDKAAGSRVSAKGGATNKVGGLVITIMGGIAEFERELIRKRCQAGIERALAKGTKFGRKAVLDAGQRRKIAERYASDEATMAELALDYDVSEPTIWRALQG